MDPFSLSPDHKLSDADELMAKYKISGVPITQKGKLVGILTNRDLRFEKDFSRKISEVMTSEGLVTAPEGTTLAQAEEILQKHKVEKLPIVDENGMLKGLITIKDIEKSVRYPNSARDGGGRLLVGAAIGVTDDMLKRAKALIDAKVDVLSIDSAHGHSFNIINAVSVLKEKFPEVPVIAGNIATAQGARELINAGADCVKVGMGPGSICTTRVVAGIGVPQITAIFDVAQVAAEFEVPVIADGGIKYSGDITKAIAAGADVVMIGSLFAGCESPGIPKYTRAGSLKCMRMGSSLRCQRAAGTGISSREAESLYRKESRDAYLIKELFQIQYTSFWAACAPVWGIVVRPVLKSSRSRAGLSE